LKEAQKLSSLRSTARLAPAAAINAPSGAARGTWLAVIFPAYLGIFVWAPFYDALWVGDLRRFHLARLFASAIGAAVLCHWLFYSGLAGWGFRTGVPLERLAGSTYGKAGARWLLGLASGLANLLIFAVAIDFAVGTTLLGLGSCGLVDRSALDLWKLGPLSLPPPVVLSTALFWVFIICMATILRLIGVVAALMRVYSPVAILVLTAIAVCCVPGLRSYRFEDLAIVDSGPRAAGAGDLGRSAPQIICGFVALAGLASVELGGAVKRRRDVVLGGVTGICLAAAWTASMALIVAASAALDPGRAAGFVASGFGIRAAQPLSFRWAILGGFGGSIGGAILILLGLAALAPGCYGLWVSMQKLSALWPRLSSTVWTWAGGGAAWLLVAGSVTARPAVVFCILGDVLGPLIGAMQGDLIRQRTKWSGPRGTFNRAGLLAWGAGSLCALAVDVAAFQSATLAAKLPPTSILGLACSGILYTALAALGLEPAEAAGGEHIPENP
jgi:hypothetical protein